MTIENDVLARGDDETMSTRSAPWRASTWNPDTWTVDVVLSAGAPVQRADARGAFDEVLNIAGATWPERLPLLDSHRRTSLDDQLGEVFNIRREGNELVGTARLSKHSTRAVRIAAEIADGARFGASIGYTASNWTEGRQGQRRQKIAGAFRINELSFVSIPADPAATIRSTDLTTTPATTEHVQTRAEINAHVRSIAKTAGLDQAWVDTQIDGERSIEDVNAAALKAMQERSAPAATVRSVHNEHTRDNPEVRVNALGEALYARGEPAHTPSDLAREYVGMSVRDIARDCMTRSGQLTTGMSDAVVIERSMQTTSDFPQIFAATANRAVRAAYEAAPSGIRQVARQSTAKDFRAKTSIGLANKFTLEPVNEAGEFKNGSFIESAESYSISPFGKIVPLSRRMLVDDDIGAFVDAAGRMGQAAAGFEADKLYEKISSNPNMADGSPVFHANHANLATGAALSVDSLSAARLKLRKQVDKGGNLIAIVPKYLIVGPEIETTAEKILTEIAAVAVDAVNPFSGKLTLVVEPRMTGGQWYIAADPSQPVSLEYSYLAGAPGPQVSSQIGFRVDGIEYKVALDFGAGWLDYRGWVKNPGA